MPTITETSVASSLEKDGIALLPNFLQPEQLRLMRVAFESRLQQVRFNDIDGYEKERFRHVIEDVLTVDQGFVDAALHPVVQNTLKEYLGDGYQLVEAKGWKSLRTTRDFHGWHGDAWYDQATVDYIPREVKLAVYLTDVNSGFFEYVKGSHRTQHPRMVPTREFKPVAESELVRVKAPAGSAFLFDTSGIHRQAVPILEERLAIFYNYHDPSVPLQKEDVDYYRYHPLLLNAAFLGGLSKEDTRVLGFGDKRNYFHAFRRTVKHPTLHNVMTKLLEGRVRLEVFQQRVQARIKRTVGR